MKVQAVDSQGNTHKGDKIKSLFITEDCGAPLAIIKETIIGNVVNYRIMTPGDDEFTQIASAMGYDIRVTKTS
jgi:hypothetical protein